MNEWPKDVSPMADEITKELDSTALAALKQAANAQLADHEIRVYLAGPFFNPDQLSTIEMLEAVLGAHFSVFSPRRDGGILKPMASAEDRQKVFADNFRGIKGAHVVVAQVAALDTRPWDFLVKLMLQNAVAFANVLENRFTSFLHEPGLGELMRRFLAILPNYSDIGTIWEMGFAYGVGVPVIAFSPKATTRFNVMLSESTRGVVMGSDEAAYARLIDLVRRVVKEGASEVWTGQVQ
jgi:nucleoside 2-deoxyribosyltransferase